MTLSAPRVASVKNAKVGGLAQQVQQLGKLAGKGGKALALQPAAPKFGRAVLYALMKSVKNSASRAALTLQLLAHLRKKLPALFAKLPLHPRDFGLKSLDDLAQYMAEWVHKLETNADSLRAFSAEKRLRGLRWQIAGKALFERLVKYHRGLGRFILEWADEFRDRMVNSNIAQRGFHMMTDGTGKKRKITSLFGKPRKVIEFRLEGGPEVRAEFTDFGALCENKAGDVLLTPIEIKMPAAMSGVKGQIADFRQRLRAATTLIAVMEDGSEKRIDVNKVVFDDDATHHLAITMFGKKRWDDAKISPVVNGKPVFQAQPIHEFKPVANASTGQPYYAMRVTVLRDWLVDLVKLVTDPKP
ncbi:MAG: hypothetical protein ABW110_08805 [Steroidobacteraceae bacterium]